MNYERIIKLLTEKGFRKVGVNVENIYIYYVVLNQEIYVVNVMDFQTEFGFTTAQYKNIRKQIIKNFSDKNYQSIHFLTIICSNNLNPILPFFKEEQDLWFLDITNEKLIIYENQCGDFLGLQKNIEELLFLEHSVEFNENEDDLDPFSDNRQLQPRLSFGARYFTKCNTLIIIMNILIFFIVERLGSTDDTRFLLRFGALYWPAFDHLNEYYRLITYMFLHSGFRHLANNMVVMFFIGDNLERAIGKWKYLVIYFASGILAGMASLSYNMIKETYVVSVGASGAIFGIVGAMVYIVAINRGRLENISTRQMVIFLIFSLYGGFTSQRVDNVAHIGGLVSGAVLAAILYRKPKTNQI